MNITFTSDYLSIELKSEKSEQRKATDDVSAALHNTELYLN
jgi:hypothetical protein